MECSHRDAARVAIGVTRMLHPRSYVLQCPIFVIFFDLPFLQLCFSLNNSGHPPNFAVHYASGSRQVKE